MSSQSGILLLDKPAGRTSFEALRPVKRALGSSRVGHTGTLDRFAEGLLVVLAGSYSRLASFFTALDKLYVARLRLGSETDTLDPEGREVARAEPCSRNAFEAAIPGFRGPILQRPPAYSAIHVDGERAYERIRRGEALEMAERPVKIHELELLSFGGDEAVIRVRCSSGTYIRALARDLALAAGSRAHLMALERLEIGPFTRSEATAPDSFEPGAQLLPLLPAAAAAMGFSPRLLPTELHERFRNGASLNSAELLPMDGASAKSEGGPIAVYASAERLLGVVESIGASLRYRCVLGD